MVHRQLLKINVTISTGKLMQVIEKTSEDCGDVVSGDLEVKKR